MQSFSYFALLFSEKLWLFRLKVYARKMIFSYSEMFLN
jgi:hypothetical protein